MNQKRIVIRNAIALALDKHSVFSDRRIAEEISRDVGRVSHVTVGNHRRRLGKNTGFVRGRDKVNRARPLTPGLRRDLRDAVSNLIHQFKRVGRLQPSQHPGYFDQHRDGPAHERRVARKKEFETLRDMAYEGVRNINDTLARTLPQITS